MSARSEERSARERYAEVLERLKGQWVQEEVEREGLLDREAVGRILRRMGEQVGLDLEAAANLTEVQEYTEELLTGLLQQYAESHLQPPSSPPPVQIETTLPQFPPSEPDSPAFIPPPVLVLPLASTPSPPTLTLEEPSISLNQSLPLDKESDPPLPSHSSPEEVSLTSKLQASIADFEALCKQSAGSEEQIAAIKAVLRTMKRQLARLTARPQSHSQASLRFRERCNRSLHDIFHFYSNKILLIGKSPSFDLIQHNSETWNISKFVRFVQDFSLLQAKKSKALDISSVKVVFAKNAHAQREMDEEQFHGALGMMAELYYSRDFDEEKGTAVAGKTAEEKREMLYRLLQFDQPNEWMKRAKGFGLPFGSHTKPLPPTHQPSHKHKGAQSLSSDLTLDKRPPTPAKRPLESLASGSSQPTRSEVSAKPAPKSKLPFTLKSLNELRPEELLGRTEDFDLSGLVAEDSSEEAAPHLLPSKSTLLKPDLRYRLTTLPQQLLQKTQVLSQAELRRSQDLLNKSMKLEEAQRERGQRVLERLRHVSQH